MIMFDFNEKFIEEFQSTKLLNYILLNYNNDYINRSVDQNVNDTKIDCTFIKFTCIDILIIQWYVLIKNLYCSV